MADERPQYQHGVGTIGGQQFNWGSGMPGKYWSIPYGDYPVTPNAPTGAWAHQVGAIPISNNVIPDPLLGRNRIGIMIHSGSAASLDQLYTQGCFKVDPQDWPNVRSEILAEANKGPLYLHVAPGGVAAFTNTKTFSQAGSDTPAANANASANTSTNPSAPAPGASANPFYSSLTQIESGGRNIPSQVDKDYPGQPGSKSQGYAQIDTPTWRQFGAKAGIDLNQYPNAMSAPPEVQQQVAYQIPLSRFGPTTLKKLGQQYGQLDTTKTVGQLAQQFAPPTAPGPVDPSAVVHGSTVNPALPTTAAPAAPAVASGATGTAAGAPPAGAGLFGGFKTQADADAFQKNLSNLDKSMGGKGLGQGQGQGSGQSGPPDVQPSLMVGPPSQAMNVSPLLAMTPMTYGQTINSLQDPSTWYAPPGGRPQPRPQQGPMGTSLNSLDPSMTPFPQSPISGMGYMGLGYSYPGGGMPYG